MEPSDSLALHSSGIHCHRRPLIIRRCAMTNRPADRLTDAARAAAKRTPIKSPRVGIFIIINATLTIYHIKLVDKFTRRTTLSLKRVVSCTGTYDISLTPTAKSPDGVGRSNLMSSY